MNKSIKSKLYLEREAQLRLLNEILKVDGRVDASELNYLRELQTEFCFTDEQFALALEQDLMASLVVIKTMKEDSKSCFTLKMREMIYRDSVVDPSELRLFQMVCILSDLEVT